MALLMASGDRLHRDRLFELTDAMRSRSESIAFRARVCEFDQLRFEVPQVFFQLGPNFRDFDRDNGKRSGAIPSVS